MKRSLIFLMLLLCTPAYAMKIYNMAPGLDMSPIEVLHDSTFVNQPNTLESQYIFNADHLDETLDTIPLNTFVMFNVEEGSGVREALNYELNPDTAVSIRRDLVEHIVSERPDLDTCLYVLPGNAVDAYKGGGSEFKAWTEREEDFRQVTVSMTSLCVGGSWAYSDYPALDWQLKGWRSKMLAQIAMAILVHGEKPKLVLSNRIKNDISEPLIPYDIADYQLAFAQEYGLEVVYWAWPSDTDFINRWLLYVYGSTP